jgi:large subunit ribosomal protein L28
MVGLNVSHSNRKSKRVQKPNIQRVRVRNNGGVTRMKVCTRCIRTGRIEKA